MREKIFKVLGVQVDNCIKIAQNSVATIYNCDNRFIVKHSKSGQFLEIEAKMQHYLKEYSDLKIPHLYYWDENLLVTEYIVNDSSCNSGCQEQIAREVAALHLVSADYFGFEYDTTIGPFLQPNSQYKSWIEFYKIMRVEYFAKKALGEGSLPKGLYERLLFLNADLKRYLIEPKRASLIHGDIWSGNVLTYKNRLAAFIDPAIYFASNEVELAFIAMFHTFDKSFFKEYSRYIAIENGFFDQRVKIYQIYPLLVHIRAFGGTYLSELENILEYFGY